MEKAEQKALEAYPVRSVLIIPARHGGYYADSHLRDGFIYGYHQAECDLALTLEDVRVLFGYFVEVGLTSGHAVRSEEFFEEVLLKFDEYKHKQL